MDEPQCKIDTSDKTEKRTDHITLLAQEELVWTADLSIHTLKKLLAFQGDALSLISLAETKTRKIPQS